MASRRPLVYLTTLLAITLAPAGLWFYLNGVKNDMLGLTRFLVRQVHRGDEESQARFYSRYRFPDGDAEPETFIALWNALDACDPKSPVYGDQTPLRCQDGKTRTHKQVIVRGETAEGAPVVVELEWVRYRGSWYIHEYAASGLPSPRLIGYPGGQ